MTTIRSPSKTRKVSRKVPRKVKAAKSNGASSPDNIPELVTNITQIIKADSQIVSNALEIEDGFINEYGERIIVPEIAPEIFAAFVEQNNTLSQCISAMEVNIDGTGYDIIRSDEAPITDADRAKIKPIKEFFTEVYPMMSLTTLRRKNRRFLETTGYGCIEVIRNPAGDIVFLRPLDSKTIRLVKLGPSYPAKKTLTRNGATVSVTIQVRERVFVQKINEKKVYFKEFGSFRDLDKITGLWAAVGNKLPADVRSSELIYMTVNKSAKTPYGVPRWLNNLPSVLGSRQAEELNLEYFNAGGIPPVMVFIAGGAMGEEARRQINAFLAGKAKDKLRGVVADIHSTTGSVDKGGTVGVQVETFDSGRQKDSMFENYDDRCEKRVRASFRLPPLFVGKADDYSFASVFASYTLAEAQVFNPERDEFDEIFNNTVMKELTGGEYIIKSKPLTVADATSKLKALELGARHRIITKNQLRVGLNVATDLSIPLEEQDGELEFVSVRNRLRRADDVAEGGQNVEPAIDGQIGQTTGVTKADLSYLGTIADNQAKALLTGRTDSVKQELIEQMKSLSPVEENIVHMLTSSRIFAVTDNDSAGLTELTDSLIEMQ